VSGFGYPADEADPSVCYRHPDRQSWVLCQRCGRTICPECQIQAPVGVQCPECVREAGGSVRWTPTSIPGGKARSGGSSQRRQPAWMRRLGTMLRPDGNAPVLSWGIIGAAIVLWIVGLVTSGGIGFGIPFTFLAAIPGLEYQIWRLVTGLIVYPGLWVSGLSVGLGTIFWLLNAPGFERQVGRGRFLAIVLSATVLSNSVLLLTGNLGYGIFAALFGIFGAYLVAMWSYPAARNQILIMLLINGAINLAIGGTVGIISMVVGVLAGGGAEYLLRWFDENRPRASKRTPYLVVFGAVAAVAIIAILVGSFS